MILSVSDRSRDYGLLILRFGVGLMFVVVHGFPKVAGGPQAWEGLGKSMAILGITFAPVFWGFMATIAEFGGGICLIAGVLYRPACFLMMFTMFMAEVANLEGGYGLNSRPLELGILFLSLIFIGPGNFTLRNLLLPKKEQLSDA